MQVEEATIMRIEASLLELLQQVIGLRATKANVASAASSGTLPTRPVGIAQERSRTENASSSLYS